MKKCPKCNNEFAWGIETCPACGKKVKNPKVELHLKNPMGQVYTINCNEKIKMSPLQLYVELRFGVPAFNVKPINGKDVAVTFILFFAIFIVAVLFSGIPFLAIFGAIALAVVNIIYTKDFYYNAIKKKLSEGYKPSDEDTTVILKNAGFFIQ